MGDDLHGLDSGQISETGRKGIVTFPWQARMRIEKLSAEFVATFGDYSPRGVKSVDMNMGLVWNGVAKGTIGSTSNLAVMKINSGFFYSEGWTAIQNHDFGSGLYLTGKGHRGSDQREKEN